MNSCGFKYIQQPHIYNMLRGQGDPLFLINNMKKRALFYW